jgi:tetratricopeptide (TPR) repeat protein
MGFFSSLFGSKKQPTPEELEKQKERKFDILKFDGVKAQRMGQIPYSIKCFTEALALKEDFSTRLYLANSYNAIQDYPLAYEQLEKMAELEPNNIETYLMMARVSDHLQNWQAMNDACQRAYLIDENKPEIYYYFGKACYGLEDEVSAIAMLTKAISLDKEYKDAYLLRSEIYCNMEQFKYAEEDIDKLLSLDANDETYLAKKAELRTIAGDNESAIKFYKTIIDQNPFNEPVIIALTQLLIGLKKYDAASKLVDEAIENKPDFAEAYKERSQIKKLQGDIAGSEEDLKMAEKLFNESNKGNTSFTNIEEEVNARYKAINPFS